MSSKIILHLPLHKSSSFHSRLRALGLVLYLWASLSWCWKIRVDRHLVIGPILGHELDACGNYRPIILSKKWTWIPSTNLKFSLTFFPFNFFNFAMTSWKIILSTSLSSKSSSQTFESNASMSFIILPLLSLLRLLLIKTWKLLLALFTIDGSTSGLLSLAKEKINFLFKFIWDANKNPATFAQHILSGTKKAKQEDVQWPRRHP